MADESSDTNTEERAEAAAMRGRQSAQSPSLEPNVQELFPAVQIDEGVFKYVLIKVQDRIMGSSFLVRGCAGAKYHKDVARPTVEALQETGIEYTVLGGGRINHDPIQKKTLVYGYSYGFPWQDDQPRHDIAQNLLQSAYPGFDVTWTNEGY